MNALWRRQATRKAAAAALLGLVMTILPVPLTPTAIAAVDSVATYLDVETDSAAGPIGSLFVLTATVFDQYGDPLEVAGTHVKLWWLDGPNDPVSPGGSTDLDCFTDATGTCTVSYTGSTAGTDVICASIGGSRGQCSDRRPNPRAPLTGAQILRRAYRR